MLEDLENKIPEEETPVPVMKNYSSVGCSPATMLREEGILETSREIDGS